LSKDLHGSSLYSGYIGIHYRILLIYLLDDEGFHHLQKSDLL
jgi:hypothetical protein